MFGIIIDNSSLEVLNENFEEIKLSNTVDMIHEHSIKNCHLCGSTCQDSLIQCISPECGLFFCNDKNVSKTQTSHIIHHLKSKNHKFIHIPDQASKIKQKLRCYICKNKNVFSLGLWKGCSKIICRVPCLVSKGLATHSTFEPLIFEEKLIKKLFLRPRNPTSLNFDRNLKFKNSFKKNNSTTSKNADLKISPILNEKNKKGSKYIIRRKYENIDQYIDIYSKLIRLENFEEIKNNKNSNIYRQVKLYFGISNERIDMDSDSDFELGNNSRNIVSFYGDEIGCKFTDRDRILIKHKSDWNSNAKIKSKHAGIFTLICDVPIPKFISRVDMTSNNEMSNFTKYEHAISSLNKIRFDECIVKAILGQETECRLDFKLNLDDYSIKRNYKLNSSQEKAIYTSLNNRVSIIHGPPGTGKTKTIVALVDLIRKLCQHQNLNSYPELNKYKNCEFKIQQLQESDDQNESTLLQIDALKNKLRKYDNKLKECYELSIDELMKKEQYFNKSSRILVCAPSNHPVFDLREKLQMSGLNPIQVVARSKEEESKNQPGTLRYLTDRALEADRQYADFQIMLNEARASSEPLTGKIEFLEKALYAMKMKWESEIIKRFNIICCTCITTSTKVFNDINFEFVIIDEATQALEPEIIQCISRGAKHLVLVGLTP